jgi:predicted membrane chloride channel (bestrophin family)
MKSPKEIIALDRSAAPEVENPRGKKEDQTLDAICREIEIRRKKITPGKLKVQKSAD